LFTKVFDKYYQKKERKLTLNETFAIGLFNFGLNKNILMDFGKLADHIRNSTNETEKPHKCG